MVQTKHGNVSTDHILFICSGAFHSCKPSDLMAELQGRLPIRVELRALGRADFHRILTEPQFNLIKQQQVGPVCVCVCEGGGLGGAWALCLGLSRAGCGRVRWGRVCWCAGHAKPRGRLAITSTAGG
jgi:hypothetical protein